MTDPTEPLRTRRRALDKQLVVLGADLAKIGEERSASTSDDEHDPEGSTLTSDWSQLSGLRRSALQQLRLTDAALARVEAGTYGNCLNCGDPIAQGRLTARPEAEFCIACAAAKED